MEIREVAGEEEWGEGEEGGEGVVGEGDGDDLAGELISVSTSSKKQGATGLPRGRALRPTSRVRH